MPVLTLNNKQYQVPDDATPDELKAFRARVMSNGDPEKERQLLALYDKPAEEHSAAGSFSENLMAGLGRSVTQTARGIGQMVGATSQEEIDEASRLDSDLMQTGGGITGNIIGDVGQVLYPAGVVARISQAPRALTAAANAISKPQSWRAAATVAGLEGASKPVTSEETRLGNAAFSATLGAGGYGAVQWLSKGAQWAKQFFDRTPSQTLDETARVLDEAGVDRPQVLSDLSSQQSYVPGSVPMTADYTGDVGIQQIRNTLRSGDKQFANEEIRNTIANDAARTAFIDKRFQQAAAFEAQNYIDEFEQLGGNPKIVANLRALKFDNPADFDSVRTALGDLRRAPLESVRGIATEPADRRLLQLVNENVNAYGQGDTSVARILQNAPRFMRQVSETERRDNVGKMLRAAVNNWTSNAQFKWSEKAYRDVERVQQVVSQLRRGEDAMATLKAAGVETPEMRRVIAQAGTLLRRDKTYVDDFHTAYKMRQQIGHLLNKAGGMDTDAKDYKAAESALLKVRDALDAQIRKVAPTFDEYLATERALYRARDQFRTGREVLGLRDPAERSFGKGSLERLDDPEGLVQAATESGIARSDVLTPAQNQALAAVREDVRRQVVGRGYGQADLDQAGNKINVSFGPVTAAAQNALNALSKSHGKDVLALITQGMKNPADLIPALARIPPARLEDIIKKYGNSIGLTLNSATRAAILEENKRLRREQQKYANLPAYGEP